MTTGDFGTDLLLVVGALAVVLLTLVVGYGVLSAFPDEVIARICRRVFGA